MSSDENSKYIITSVRNAMRILRLFKIGREEFSVTEIAAQTNLPKSTAYRLISKMADEGFLSKNPKTNHYRLGLSILTVGGVITSHRDLFKEAKPIVERVVDMLGETAHICLLENNDVVYLLRNEGPDSVRLLTYMGRKNPLHCTSEGLALLAYQDEKTIHKYLEKDLYAYTPSTITERDELEDYLIEIKKNGYVISKDHFYEGYVGIAAPIRDYSENVVASLSVIGPTSRITEEQYPVFIKTIMEASKEISSLLGYYA
ncbi:IclR family transcriptional regulator [Neobacillus sp. 3P2-tot-E-2]|uniref:IclR family transcriptional regulator n=1 Tax=Neobacillus sp. 3P2-tot-E-2 TaxID=3132212 RepID=UPI0039A16A76